MASDANATQETCGFVQAGEWECNCDQNPCVNAIDFKPKLPKVRSSDEFTAWRVYERVLTEVYPKLDKFNERSLFLAAEYKRMARSNNRQTVVMIVIGIVMVAHLIHVW